MLYTNCGFVQSVDYLLNPWIVQNERYKQQNMQFMDVDESEDSTVIQEIFV